MKIIGLTGLCCSGKDTVADYLSTMYGYKHYSLSDIIRQLLSEETIVPTRVNLAMFGVNLRKKYGNSILVKYILKNIKGFHYTNKYCISSIRHTAEVIELRHIGKFILVNVIAPIYLRFLRMQRRCRLGDPTNILDFVKLEKQEDNKQHNSYQQVSKTAKMADITIVNDTDDLRQLTLQVRNVLSVVL
jgi:dephospho-CoA kinase